jgi:hypothetical protein
MRAPGEPTRRHRARRRRPALPGGRPAPDRSFTRLKAVVRGIRRRRQTALPDAPGRRHRGDTTKPPTADRVTPTGFIEKAGSMPLGRPRWLHTTTRPPRLRNSAMVGTAARMRKSSPTTPPEIGTLRSADQDGVSGDLEAVDRRRAVLTIQAVAAAWRERAGSCCGHGASGSAFCPWTLTRSPQIDRHPFEAAAPPAGRRATTASGPRAAHRLQCRHVICTVLPRSPRLGGQIARTRTALRRSPFSVPGPSIRRSTGRAPRPSTISRRRDNVTSARRLCARSTRRP